MGAKALRWGKAFRVLRSAKEPSGEECEGIRLGLAGHGDEVGFILNAT